MRLYRSRLETSLGALDLVASETGLAAVGLGEMSWPRLESWLARAFAGASIEATELRTAEAAQQLREYFQGRRRVFDLPLDIRGTEFQRRVWRAVAEIPYGRTASYGDIAHCIGKPLASRAVGAANGANPLPIVIPCHRVIGTDGSLTGYGGGLSMKSWLLAHEGALQAGAVQMGLFRSRGGGGAGLTRGMEKGVEGYEIT